jgi:hypothetical protein
MNTRGSSGQKRNGAGGEVAADELCFLPSRRIERGLFGSPSMNTRSCLSAQKRKEGPGCRPVGPYEEEVAGANDDDDDTSDSEEATIKFSFPDRKSVKKTSDEELLVIISEGISCLPLCGTTSCDYLDILSDVNVWECVAQYLLQFARKSKYNQDSIILEWYKYAIAARIGRSQPLWFCLPYDATLNTDIDCLCASQKHRLCLLGMRSLFYLGCVHCWVSETSEIDPSEEPPLPLVSCLDIREQGKRAM